MLVLLQIKMWAVVVRMQECRVQKFSCDIYLAWTMAMVLLKEPLSFPKHCMLEIVHIVCHITNRRYSCSRTARYHLDAFSDRNHEHQMQRFNLQSLLQHIQTLQENPWQPRACQITRWGCCANIRPMQPWFQCCFCPPWSDNIWQSLFSGTPSAYPIWFVDHFGWHLVSLKNHPSQSPLQPSKQLLAGLAHVELGTAPWTFTYL